ncbi:MAG: hypothetical protein ABI763_05380 [Bacteroidota bacterium]
MKKHSLDTALAPLACTQATAQNGMLTHERAAEVSLCAKDFCSQGRGRFRGCVLILLFIFSILNSFSQNPLVKMWDKRFGGMNDDYFISFQQTSDRGYILAGFSWSGINGDKTQLSYGSADYWVVKIDSLGNKQWDKDFGGTGADQLFSIQQTKDGGFILAGSSTSGISGNKTQDTVGLNDFWIVKLDSIGNQQWDKNFGGTNEDWLHIVQQTTDGGYILGGYSFSGINGDKTQANWDTTGSTYDYWIVKTDSLGNKQWDKDFGGLGDDGLHSLQQTIDGSCVGILRLRNQSKNAGFGKIPERTSYHRRPHQEETA